MSSIDHLLITHFSYFRLALSPSPPQSFSPLNFAHIYFHFFSICPSQGPESGGVEVVCEGSTHSITSGGGFSSFYDVPAYQTAAVNAYFTAAAASGHKLVAGYSQGRGYPDVTLAGYNYYTRIGGKYYTVSGTSASCPAVAGMISNINAARLAKNKGSVGWLNPTLYSNYGSFTNDITSGRIHCVATGTCCKEGFWATPGWDPASGLGSLNYGKLETLLISLGQVNTLADIPTDPPVSRPKSKVAFNSDGT